jgi:integrase
MGAVYEFPDRLAYDGLKMIFRRRAEYAGIPVPQIHGFRRAFALKMLREDVDVHTIARLLGHANTQVLYRYLKISGLDTEKAFKKVSPVDKGLRGS